MKIYRIKAVALRHLMLTFRDFHRFIDLIYWPLLEIIIWGFTARWIQGSSTENLHMSLVLLSALVFWQVILRSQLEISFGFLDELWSHNLINLFATPLKISEWIIAVMIVGFLKSLFTFLFGVYVIWVFYGLNMLKPGVILIPYLVMMIATGWAIGFLTTAAVAYWGQKIQTLAWVMGWFFAPFSGVFYPISVLPHWAQLIAQCIPMSYLFEGLRTIITTGIFPIRSLGICCFLIILYLFCAILLFKFAFEKSKVWGLSRLERYE